MDSSTSNAVIQALLDDIDRLKLAVPKATLPGKLGNSTMQLKDDPRADPRMVAKMAELGLDVDPAKPPVDMNSSPRSCLLSQLAQRLALKVLVQPSMLLPVKNKLR